MKRMKPPYTAYEYNSINTHVLERVINAVTGKDIPELFSERAWRKMGAQNDGYVAVNKYGLANSFGFISSVLRDLGRWGCCSRRAGAR
jgi:CubicO group peptidase (beta-lactamase class C family)